MCNKTCKCSKKSLGTISITAEEKDLLVRLLNDTLFRIHDLVVADKILTLLDQAFPITEE